MRISNQKFLLCLLLFLFSTAFGESLYVYYPSTVRPNLVQQKAMEGDSSVTVTVFGKYRDFQNRVKNDNPSAILTKSETASDFQQFKTVASAKRVQPPKARYILLSINPDFTLESVSETTVVGTVDFMKRSRVTTFVKDLLGASPKISHVTKVEDLLPLLTFKMADAVILNERDVEYFKKRSNLDFITIELATDTVLATLGTTGNSTGVIEVAKRISRLLPNYLGGVEWGM